MAIWDTVRKTQTTLSSSSQELSYLSSLYAIYIPTSGTTMIIIQSKVVEDID